jgi:hypothetical protein
MEEMNKREMKRVKENSQEKEAKRRKGEKEKEK